MKIRALYTLPYLAANAMGLCVVFAGLFALFSPSLQNPSASTATIFSYFSGYPKNCTQPSGYADLALCSILGETPLGNFFVPATGGSYVDANFGGTVRVLSDHSIHGYSSPSAFSATGKYVSIARNNQQTNIVEVASAQMVYTSRPGTVSADTPRWDAFNDDVYYYFSGAKVMKHTLSTNTTQTLRDFGTQGFTAISGGGTGDTTKDNWLGFWDQSVHKVCAINLSTTQSYCADYQATAGTLGYSFIDYVLVSKGKDSVSGKRYVIMTASPAAGIFTVNESAGTLDYQLRGPEYPVEMAGAKGNKNGVCEPGENCLSTPHADLFEDSDGQQYLSNVTDMESPCARMAATFRLNAGQKMLEDVASGGGRNTSAVLHRCGGAAYEVWVDYHTGCARNAPYCVLSSDDNGNMRNPTDLTSALKQSTHRGEIMIMKGNGQEIRRVAATRSVLFTNDSYWSTARASISPNGSLALFDTNFGYPNNGQYVVTVTTGYSGPAQAQVSITSPLAKDSLFNTVSISAAVSGAQSVAGVQFYVDGTVIGAEDTQSPYSVNWNTLTYTSEPHTLTAKARDAAGNIFTSPPVSIYIINGGPPNRPPPRPL